MQDQLHNTVREYRGEAHITQEQLAEMVQVSRQTIIAIEKGNYTPSVALALKIARVFKIPIERIFNL